MSEFVKVGNKAYVKPNGSEYDLEKGKVYNLVYDNWAGDTFLELGESICLPNKIYTTDAETKFMNKVMNNFKSNDNQTTGVLLCGLKGSGKTITAKKLALNCNAPIIVVSANFPTRHLCKFFNKFKDTPVCVLFDEIDKNEQYWKTEDLLSFLDGVNQTAKKLVLFTCNSNKNLNEFIMDRCSRIRYRKIYGIPDIDDVKDFINFLTEDKEKTEAITEFVINNIKTLSYDNIKSFVTEVNSYPEESFESLLNDMNIDKTEK